MKRIVTTGLKIVASVLALLALAYVVFGLLITLGYLNRLGHGYRIIEVGGNLVIVDADNRGAVDPDVLYDKVMEPFVVGERGRSYDPSIFSQKYGFFILDMRDGSLIEGLDKAGFAAALAERGLKYPF